MNKTSRYSLLALTALIFASALFAVYVYQGEPALIPRKVLFGNPVKTAPKISPDGTLLAYLAPDQNDVLNIWVRGVYDESSAKQVTSDKKRGIRQYLWEYDNNHLLYIQDHDGDENWHVYQIDLKTGVTRDLTPFEGVRSDLVAYDPTQPNTLLVQLNLQDRTRFDIYRVDLDTGAVVLDTQNPDNAVDLTPDNNLVVRAAQSYTEDGGTLIRVRDSAQAPWRELLRWGPEESMGSVSGFSPDNKSLYLSTSVGANTSGLVSVDIESGKQTPVASDPTYDIAGTLEHPTTHELQAVAVEREKLDWIVLDKAIQKDFDTLAELGAFQIMSRTLDDKKWVVAVSSDVKPTHFYLYDRESQKPQFLFSTQPELDEMTLSPMKPISFPARDGLTLHGYLTLPPFGPQKNLPTVLLVHGGPWARDRWGFTPLVQWLANRGYAVLQINFRGSTGYGKQHLNAGNQQWGAKMHQDLLDAKEWAITQGYSDPQRVAIFGGSYGGYATLAALTFTPEEFCCGVDIVGPSNLVTLLETLPPYWTPSKVQFDQRVGSLEKNRDLLRERSPLFKADRIVKPLLIAQGANDPRVKQAESDQIVAVMRENQQPVEYLLFSDEGHGFARPENRLKFYAAAEHFLKQSLGGREEPPSADESWEALRQ